MNLTARDFTNYEQIMSGTKMKDLVGQPHSILVSTFKIIRAMLALYDIKNSPTLFTETIRAISTQESFYNKFYTKLKQTYKITEPDTEGYKNKGTGLLKEVLQGKSLWEASDKVGIPNMAAMYCLRKACFSLLEGKPKVNSVIYNGLPMTYLQVLEHIKETPCNLTIAKIRANKVFWNRLAK